MKTKRFDFNFRPLQINVSMTIVGSVPGSQNYNADTGEYIPDYTIDASNLVIQPIVGIIDKDEVLTPGPVNSSLANVAWSEIDKDGNERLIESTNTNYNVVTSGNNAGRITVKKNADPKQPINLKFRAEYLDPRNAQVYQVYQTYQVQCKNATQYIPVLYLDAADQTVYNPLADVDTQTVHASLRVGTSECPEGKRIFAWEVLREDGTFTTVGDDTVMDYDVSVSEDGTSCTVDRSLMGDELTIRCRAKYDVAGNPSSVELGDSSPSCVVSFVRRIPKFEYDISGVPTNIPAGLLSIKPEAKIWGTNGIIDNPEKELLPLWYAATNKAGQLSYSLVAHGIAPTLSTDKMSNTAGAVYGLDVIDVGPECVWEDSDGALFEDGDGNLITIK